jgi:hypothetical protein
MRMLKRLWANFGQVAGLLALFIALGGPAEAANLINGAKIKASSITGKQIKDSSLTGADVKAATIDGSDVKDASLTGADVADGSIGAADIAPGVIPAITQASPPNLTIPDGSITTAKFANDAVAPSAAKLPAFRTEATPDSPNLIGGFDGNSVSASIVGASLLGGGATGFKNEVTGNYGTVPGGQGNKAGAFSLAAGRRAKANHTGSFVWADSTNADFTSTADNQFSIRAANGVVIANDAGNARVVPVGTRYRDNSIVAWARVTATGGLDTKFNVASVTHVGTGHYKITLASPMQSGFSLIPAITPEIDEAAGNVPPTGAANMRIAASNQFAAGTNFDVYMYNGSYASVDNDFQVLVTGR